MALQGNLRDFGATQLLNLVHLAGKTGTLLVDSKEGRARLAFREGKLIHAEFDKDDGQLIGLLRRTNKLTDEQVRALRARAENASDKEIGLLLINSRYVSQQDILQVVRDHSLQVIYRLFGWAEGAFRFEQDAQPPDGVITVAIELDNVIMEGARRAQESEHLADELPNLDLALKFADRPTANLRQMNLSVDEWRVVSYVNPKNSIRQIAQASRVNEADIRRIVYGLLQAGLVEVVRPAVLPPADAGRRSTAVLRDQADRRTLVNRLIHRIRSI